MRGFLRLCFRRYQHFLFNLNVEWSKKPLLLLDVDNTVADTWPSLSHVWSSEKERIACLLPHQSVIDYVLLNFPYDQYEWIFLTSRSYSLRSVTVRWLQKHKLPATYKNVILVRHPSEKIELISRYVKVKAVFIDDMSFNHEKDEVMFYSKEIQDLTYLSNVKYIGFHAIDKIIKNYEKIY